MERQRIEQLYAAHHPGAVRLAYLLTGDAALAEDLAQEAFLKASGRLTALRDPERFGAYLRRTVVRSVLDERRSSGREARRMERVAPPEARPDGATALAARHDLFVALRSLTVRQRTAVVLRYWHDLPEREVARLMGCRPGTVKSTLSRALDALRSEVDRGD